MSTRFLDSLQFECPLAFDYQATTPCAQEVLTAMNPYWNQNWGNPSSRQSRLSVRASAAVGLAREQLSISLGIKPDELIFTSGATEANNLALLGYARAKAIELGRPGHLITLSTEHHSVLDPLRQLQREGFQLTEIRPNSDGLISVNQLEMEFQNNTILVSIMLANNEIGVVQPLKEIGYLCKENQVVLHSDCAQACGFMSMNFSELPIDLISLSCHKLYGPKGIGALVLRSDIDILPLQWGGGQEKGLRPGTLPVPLVVGFAKAVEIAVENLSDNHSKLLKLRNKLWFDLKSKIPDLVLNGSLDARLPHNLNFTVGGVLGSRLHRELKPFISLSSGSACSNGEASHVLMSLGLTAKEAESSIRMSLGLQTTLEDINHAVFIIETIVKGLRFN